MTEKRVRETKGEGEREREGREWRKRIRQREANGMETDNEVDTGRRGRGGRQRKEREEREGKEIQMAEK